MNSDNSHVSYAESRQPSAEDNVLDILKAFSNDIRLEIITLLSQNNRNVTQLQTDLKIKQPSVSRHLKLLLDSDVVRRIPSGNQNYYSLNTKPLEQLQSFISKLVVK